MYTITWETNFGDQVESRANEPIPTSLPNGEQPAMSNAEPSDVGENEVDYITTTDGLNDVTDAPQRRIER